MCISQKSTPLWTVVFMGLTISGTSAQTDTELEKAISFYDAVYSADCRLFSESIGLFDEADEQNPLRFQLSYKNKFDEDTAPKITQTFYQFFCDSGAYNQRFVYFESTENGFLPIAFAAPNVDVSYTDESEVTVSEIKPIGFVSYFSLTNPEFSADKETITARGYWRGIGDAYEQRTFVYDQGQFVLKRFEVDATYDEVTSPQLVVEY